MYGKAHTLHLKHCIHPYCQPTCHCSKCKGPGHICHDCGAYQCTRCLAWGLGHTTPNCSITKEAQEMWERSKEWATAAENWSANPNRKTHEEQWRDAMKMWAGVSAIPNEEWMKARKVTDLTSHLLLLLLLLHPPLSLTALISLAPLVACHPAPPFSLLRSMLVTSKIKWGVMLQTLFLDTYGHLQTLTHS